MSDYTIILPIPSECHNDINMLSQIIDHNHSSLSSVIITVHNNYLSLDHFQNVLVHLLRLTRQTQI